MAQPLKKYNLPPAPLAPDMIPIADRARMVPPRPDRRGAIQPRLHSASNNPFADMIAGAIGQPPTPVQQSVPQDPAVAPPPRPMPQAAALGSAPLPVTTSFANDQGGGAVGDTPSGEPPGGPPTGEVPTGGGNSTPTQSPSLRPNHPQVDPDPLDPATQPPPQGYDPNDWATALSWLAGAEAEGHGADYQWLKTTPNAISDYRRDAQNLELLGIGGIDFTDWARMQGYNSPIDRGSLRARESFKRGGGTDDDFQTFVRWMADGVAKYGAQVMQPYAQILTATPGFIRSYMYDMNEAEKAGFTGIHFADWLKYQGGAPSPLAGKMGQASADAMAKWANFKDHGTPDPNVQTPVYPPAGGGGDNPNPTPTPSPTPVPPPPANPIPPPGPPVPVVPPPTYTAGDPTLPNFEELMKKQIADLEARMNPLYQQQRDDIQRRTSHLGSLTGAINSGGFGETLNDALSQQYAQEQATTAPQITQLTMAAQANALEKFKTDMSTILTREQIRTNADLERSAQALQRYGIDKNDLLERYKSELALKGQQYSADREVDAAALHAAAANAAAAASAEASKYATDTRYRTDLFQGDIAREKNIMDYELGIMGLGPDWAKLILGSDPFGILTGSQAPGDVIVRP